MSQVLDYDLVRKHIQVQFNKLLCLFHHGTYFCTDTLRNKSSPCVTSFLLNALHNTCVYI